MGTGYLVGKTISQTMMISCQDTGPCMDTMDTSINHLPSLVQDHNNSAQDNQMETIKTSSEPLTYHQVDITRLEQNFSSQYYHLGIVSAILTTDTDIHNTG